MSPAVLFRSSTTQKRGPKTLRMLFGILIALYGLLHFQFQQRLDHVHNNSGVHHNAIRLRTTTTTTTTSTRRKTNDRVSTNNSSNNDTTILSQDVVMEQSDHQNKQKKEREKKNKKKKLTTNLVDPVPTEFVRQDGVVIVTKIHGPHQWGLVLQSMCLFHHAYNQRLLYDIIIFTAEPVDTNKVASLRTLLSPVQVTVVQDNRGLQKEIDALTPLKRKLFLQKCSKHNNNNNNNNNNQLMMTTNVTRRDDEVIMAAQQTNSNLTWFSDCGEGRLAYNWQAEFRSIHIWNHVALQRYRWMMWMDTDVFCTKRWDRDPIAFAIHHGLVLLFDNFPGGGSRNLATRIAKGFNVTVCKARVTPQGEFERTLGSVEDAVHNEHCNNTHLRSIYGFLHITNLDFYRSPTVQYGIRALLGDNFLARDPDDQQAVTIPAVILAPERSWDMRKKGIRLDVVHNLHMDGKVSEKVLPFTQLWPTTKLREEMGPLKDACPITESK
ncbi:hypothetical protein IV203_024416 [Nitzschia inconspicua]|uniref:Uncharacterized protein n=1 Tax=Nitzschia inconspicua TaxID=303405 RepID=A0A9K3PB18_9STRA|nr:hypothetical protein IV203_024416 [Nitzschia inconspicua]